MHRIRFRKFNKNDSNFCDVNGETGQIKNAFMIIPLMISVHDGGYTFLSSKSVDKTIKSYTPELRHVKPQGIHI